MPRLVVVRRYLKSGSSKNLSNYVKYIATREGAATVKENNGTAPATKNQQELISSLLKDFSDSKSSFAYEEYRSSPTQKNASKFIEESVTLKKTLQKLFVKRLLNGKKSSIIKQVVDE